MSAASTPVLLGKLATQVSQISSSMQRQNPQASGALRSISQQIVTLSKAPPAPSSNGASKESKEAFALVKQAELALAKASAIEAKQRQMSAAIVKAVTKPMPMRGGGKMYGGQGNTVVNAAVNAAATAEEQKASAEAARAAAALAAAEKEAAAAKAAANATPANNASPAVGGRRRRTRSSKRGRRGTRR